MELKEVLHLYLGCDVLIEKSCYNLVHEHGVHAGDIKPLTIDLLWLLTVYYELCILKIILRKLSDMTEEEAIWIASMVFTDAVSDKEKGEIGKAFIEYEFLNKPIIGTSKMYNSISEFSISNMPEITCYLLSKHFDLFNLIPE